MRDKILVLGIGNYLMGDEGIGVHLARHLQLLALPIEIEVAASSTDSFHLLDYFSQYKTIVLVYAVLDNQPVGAMRTLRPKNGSDFPPAIYNYQIGMKEVESGLQWPVNLPNVWLITVSIAPGQRPGVELSPAVAAILPLLIEKVDKLAHSFLQTEVAL